MSVYWYVWQSGAGTRPVLRSGTAPDEETALAQAGPGETVGLGAASDVRHYLLDGELREREPLPAFDLLSIAADGVTAASVAGLPLPARVVIDGPTGRVEFDLTDTSLSVVADDPGRYRVRIVPASARWLPLEAEVHAA